MKRSYKLYGLIHECVVDAGANTHEVLTPCPELVEFVGQGRVAPGARVIDLGCGCGRNAVWLAQQGFNVTAVDVSPHAVQLAKALAVGRGAALHVVEADVTDLSEFPENHYELAYDNRCLHLIIEQHLRDAYLKGVRRILRPSGIFLAINIGGRDEEEALDLVASDGKAYQCVCEGTQRVGRWLPSCPVAPMWPDQHRAELEAAGLEVEAVDFSYVEGRRPAKYQIRTVARRRCAA
jgi:SAM-dependent methyltransferase